MTVKQWLPLVLLIALIGGVSVFGPNMAGRIAFAVESGKQDALREELAELAGHDRLSKLFRQVAKVVKPAVVEVRVSKKVRMRGFGSQDPRMDEFMRRFFGEDWPGLPERGPNRGREFFQRGLGSGVIVDAENGYVLTNHHVVGGADQVEVVLADKRRLRAEWVRTDPPTDLAIIKIPSENLTAAPLGDSDDVEVGDWVLAIGAPEGLPQTVTAGIVSAKGRLTGRGAYENFIQTDAAINHGNSGGPLVNMRGQVVGINAAIVSRTGVNEGIGLAIPANMAAHVMDQLIDNGKVVRGYLGVIIQDVDEALARSFDLPKTQGALISQVAEDGPAENAGLEAGDFVVAVGGKPVRNVNALRHAVARIKPGRSVKLRIYRDGKPMTVDVELGSQPAEIARAMRGEPDEADEADVPSCGLKVATLDDDLAEKYGIDGDVEGVLIVDVEPDSQAARKGLSEGMIIVAVQGEAVGSAEQFSEIVSRAENKAGVRLKVRDAKGRQRFIFLSLEARN